MLESLLPRSANPQNRVTLGESGVSLIELLIAMTVLAVGMLGCVVMILAGVQSNSRNKTDTTAVVLDQEILEMFATYKNYPTTGFVAINDCGVGVTSVHNASIRLPPHLCPAMSETLIGLNQALFWPRTRSPVTPCSIRRATETPMRSVGTLWKSVQIQAAASAY
jgi:prepilin-type N-terminal cleavage/methylation domain-containing protein